MFGWEEQTFPKFILFALKHLLEISLLDFLVSFLISLAWKTFPREPHFLSTHKKQVVKNKWRNGDF